MEFYLILGNTKAGVFNRGKECLTKGEKNTVHKWLNVFVKAYLFSLYRIFSYYMYNFIILLQFSYTTRQKENHLQCWLM